MSQKKLTEMRRKAVVVAVAAALPVMMAGNVYADCTGTAGMATSPQIRCNNNNDDGAAANVTVSDTSTYVDQTNAGGTTYATGGSILLQFDGHGRTLTVNQNALLANYRNVDNTRTAVTMGASTTNASASTVFATQTLGSSVNLLGANGSTVVATVNSGTTINLPGNTAVTLTYGSGTTGTLVKLNTGTLTNSLVGQSLVFGRWDASDSDFVPGESYKIVAYDATNRLLLVEGTLSSNFAGPGSSSLPLVYSIVSNYGQGTNKSFTGNAAALFGSSHFYNNVVNNAGTIASRLQPSELSTSDTSPAAPYNSAIYGIRTSVAGDYLIDNAATGVIKVTHAGIGNAYAIEEGGTVLRLDIRNAGLIEAERTQALTPDAVKATGNPTATSAGLSFDATTLGLANAVNTQEEAEVLNVYNASTGIIRSKGDYSGTFYMRAGEKNIVNDGLIEHLSNAAAVASASTFANMSNAEKYGKGFAIGSVSNGGEIRELNLTNNGTIHGDILAVNGNALRWYLLSTVGDTTSNTLGSAAAITAGLNSRLTINSHTGQENSNITNNGTIIGNIWLSNGEHELENSGILTGNIDVDQRATVVHNISTSCSSGSSSGCTGAAGNTSVSTPNATTVLNEDRSGVVTTNYRIQRATPYGTNGANGISTITETIAVTPGTGKFTLENSGVMTGNITVNQVQPTSLALQDLTACSKTSSGCNGTAGTPSSTQFTQTFNNGPTLSGTVTMTPYGSNASNANQAGNGTQTSLTGVTVNLTALGNLSREFTFENSGRFDGNITLTDAAASHNTITLIGDGFGRKADGTVNASTGNITAVNGTGNNILNLQGTGTLRGNVAKFTTLNLGAPGSGGGGGDDDADAGAPNWTIATGKTAEFTTANLNAGLLNVLGTLKANTIVGEDATLVGMGGTITGDLTSQGTVSIGTLGLTVDGNVDLSDAVLTGAGTLTLKGDNRTNVITMEGDNGFTGALDASQVTSGTSTLNLEGSGTLSGNVTNFTTLNFNGEDEDVWTLAAGKTFEFTDAANLNGGLLNLLGNLKANTIVGEDATLKGTGTVQGNLTNHGTVDLTTGTFSVTGNATFNADSVLKTTIASAASYGKLAVTGNATFANGAILKPVAQTRITNGQSFTVMTYGGTLSGTPEVQGNGLVKWEVAGSSNTNGNLVLTAEVGGANVAGVSSAGAKALDALMSFDSDLGLLVQNLESEEEVRKAAEQLRPEINGAAFQAVMGMTDKVFGLVDTHLGETHLAQLTGKSGIATGEQPNGTGVWLQGFGFSGEQERRNRVDGYEADAYGFALGADTLVGSGNLRLGAAFSYGHSNIDDSGINQGNKTDIESYQATLYGSMRMDGWYLNASLGLARHDFDTKRIVLGNIVDGSHDAWQYSARAEAGWPLTLGAVTLTPVASLAYSRLDEDGYTERGTGALRIGSRDTDSFRSGLGAKALIPLHAGEVKSDLELRAVWHHEFADTRQDTTARFSAGGATFTTRGVNPADNSANLGVTLTLAHADKDVRQSLQISYDAEIKDQYVGQTGMIQARFDF